jgi:hypothetical protein
MITRQPRRKEPERGMTSTTGATTSRTRTNKRSTSRITGLKAVSNKQVNEA